MRASAALSNVQVTGANLNITYVVLAISLIALAIAWVLRAQVLAASDGTEKMREIAEAIQEGAAAYLARQFRTLSYFVGIVFFLLFALPADTTSIRIGRSLFFLMGAGFSALVGYNGMWLAVRANVRVAEAARQKSAEKAVQIAFRTGGVVGMTTVGLGLIGASGAVLIFRENAPTVLEGFGFGAAMLAMFMRVGGGIFTKAADVGADLVGKVEKNIPEDDPRNAATIADNVGDNVGDCAGMAADLFESYAVTLVAALILGKAAFGNEGLIYPLIVPAIGIVTAVIGIFLTKLRSTDKSAMSAINRSFFLSAVISAGLTGLATFTYLPAKFDQLTNFSPKVLEDAGNINPRVLAFGAVLIGIALAAAIQVLTGFFTEVGKRPVNDVAASSQTGAATVLLAGISVGFESAVYSGLLIAASVFGAFLLGGGSIVLSLFAIAIAGTGLLTTVGVIVAMDTFGPISDNAQGIAEMSGDVKGEAAQILTSLDAVGNTTKAITKGIAIATAVLAATALFGAFTDAIKEAVIKAVGEGQEVALQYQGVLDVADPRNLVGLIIGAAVVFLFSGLAINAVSRAAGAVVMEVRNQFKMHPGIMNGTEKPEYGRVVDICTRDSLRELATPGILAVMAPIAVGFGLGVGALGAYLAGAIGTGTLMAVFLSNSGGAWDNAKKMVEDGNYGGKGSDAHAATIVGDTVGDPFKDTAGPAINPLIKVMNLVGLLITPAIVSFALPTQQSTSLIISLVAVALIIGALIRNRRQATSIEY
ncbi:sodium-translocating pyrophosphatase [Candidatus Planktophila lacus]|uniref:sodium-translocating pyrophosphatase n=1 Tax=Candidatus Planktophila lacus TaxID=1884913 RepID=UPI00167FE2B0|nr:sodium-translocating pyrophosphatase [Candidatus Planktophila lacus]